jgi:hypothetical protein
MEGLIDQKELICCTFFCSNSKEWKGGLIKKNRFAAFFLLQFKRMEGLIDQKESICCIFFAPIQKNGRIN